MNPMSGPPIAPAEQIAQAFAQVTETPNQEYQQPSDQGQQPQPQPQQEQSTEFTPEYVQRLRQEAAAYRQRAGLIDGINPSDIEALAPLLDALRNGDTETIDEWAAGLYEARGLAERFAASQGQMAPTNAQYQAAATTQAAVQQAAQQGTMLTPEQVREMFREELFHVEQGWRQEQARLDAQSALEAEFRNIGINPNSEVARSVARIGRELSYQQGRFVPPAEAYEAWRQMMAPMFNQPQAGQQPNQSYPAPPIAPPGVPAAVDNRGSDPSERARGRIDAFLRGNNG